MKKSFFLTLLFLLLFNFSNSQDIYSTKYKIVNTKNENKKDNDSKFEDLFLNSMVFNFYSNENITYLKETKILDADGINSKISGDENIFINYKNNSVCYNLDVKDFYTYENLMFKKSKSNIKILGMNTTKYVSSDGNIIIYTSKSLPWFVQPCLISSNQFNECIVKFDNLKTKNGFEMIEFKKIKSTKSFEDIQTKLTSEKVVKKKTVISPFFK